VHFNSPLFDPSCPVTGAHRRFDSNLAGFDESLWATIPPSPLVDFSPLSIGAFRQRSSGWGEGSIGVTIGGQSALRLDTAESDIVRSVEDIAYRLVARRLGQPTPTRAYIRSSRRMQCVVDEACSFMMSHMKRHSEQSPVERAKKIANTCVEPTKLVSPMAFDGPQGRSFTSICSDAYHAARSAMSPSLKGLAITAMTALARFPLRYALSCSTR
jgi:hypothetical protein